MVAHAVMLRGVGAPAAAMSPPTIVKRTDQDFISAILDELQKDGVAAVQHRPDDRVGGILKLFQPVHGTFYVVLVDVLCDTFGQPRLDPERIESAGLVVRRVQATATGGAGSAHEGWRQAGGRLRGWVPFATDEEEALDPDPARRPLRLQSRNPEIHRRLHALRGAPAEVLSEAVSPLFVAPPAVCTTVKKTLLFGVVPVTSSEHSETERSIAYADADVLNHISTYLTARNATRRVPGADTVVDSSFADAADLQDYIGMLRQLLVEFDAFGDSAESQQLLAALNTLSLPYDDGTTRPAGNELANAAAVLVKKEPGSVKLPREWPAVSDAQAASILSAVKQRMQRSLAENPEERFEDVERQYQLRAFVRVKRPDGCPPETVWSAYSEPFTIAAWYDSGGQPPVRIRLPEAGLLKALKPNVAFAVPKSLFNSLQGTSLKGLIDGNKPSGGFDIDWICSFSIPVITFCAFLVLNIFLQLFDLVFQWMAFIKICIPIPKRK